MLSEHESADRGVSGTPWGSFTPQPMSRLIQHLATLAEATRRSPAPGVVGVGEWPGLPDPVRQAVQTTVSISALLSLTHELISASWPARSLG